MDQLAFVPLAASLLVFLLSTRQFALRWRALTWLAGALLTALAIWLALSRPNPTTFLEIAIRYPDALLKALDGNWQSISAALPPMFDILCVATILVAIGCLIAFTPGEAVERFVVPFNVALLGAIGGALIALAIAGAGFGGAVKRKVYIGVIDASDVHDADTIIMGDVSLRLWGIDGPEKTQPCENSREAESCGSIARGYLINLAQGQLLVCTKPNGVDGNLRESFGRPLVECVRQSDGLNIGKAMFRVGCAELYSEDGKQKSWDETEIPTRDNQRVCPRFAAPDVWRKQR